MDNNHARAKPMGIISSRVRTSLERRATQPRAAWSSHSPSLTMTAA